MSNIIRGGQRGSLFPVLDPRLKAITDRALAEREAAAKFDQMLIDKTSMGGSSAPATQFYANPNSGAYATQYSPVAADADAAKRTQDHITEEERAAVDMTGDSGPAPSPYRGIAPKYTLERQEQSLQSAADRGQAELGDMLAEQQDITVPPLPADYTSTNAPAIEDAKFADIFKQRYLAREAGLQDQSRRERLAKMASDVAPMDTTGRGGPFPDMPSQQELADSMGKAARDGRPRIEGRDMTPEELATTLPTAPKPKPKPARPVSMKEVLDARASETQEADKRRGVRTAVARPQLEAGPEALKPGPGELQEGEPAAAQARAKPLPVPADPKLRDRYLATVWPQIKQIAEGRGVGQNLLREVYDMAAQQGGHRAGIEAIQSQVGNLRTEAIAGAQALRRERLIEDDYARRMGVSPQAFQHYKSLRQDSNIDDTTAHLIMLDMQFPGRGYGNLAAMHMKNQAEIEQAGNLNQGNQNLLPADKERENLARIMQQGAAPGLIPGLVNHYRSTPDGAANPGGATKFALDNATPAYQALHGKQDLTPEQKVFVQQYVRSFPNFQAFRAQAGIEDTPANREWYTRITGRPAATVGERLWNATTDAASDAADAGRAAVEWGKEQLFGKPKPTPEQVAADEKKKRRKAVFKD